MLFLFLVQEEFFFQECLVGGGLVELALTAVELLKGMLLFELAELEVFGKACILAFEVFQVLREGREVLR